MTVSRTPDVPGCTPRTVNQNLTPAAVTVTLRLARGWDARIDAPSRPSERLYTSAQRVSTITLHLTGDLQVVTLTNPS